MRARRSSSDMSGRKTTMVSYWRRPGGHCGSSFSSTAVAEPLEDRGSLSPSNPPSKKEPEKSRVRARTERRLLGFAGNDRRRLLRIEIEKTEGERKANEEEERDRLDVRLREDKDAMEMEEERERVAEEVFWCCLFDDRRNG